MKSCIKCGNTSGNDWSQCGDVCPMRDESSRRLEARLNNEPIQYLEEGYLNLEDIIKGLKAQAELNFDVNLMLSSGVHSSRIVDRIRESESKIPSDCIYMAARVLKIFETLSKRKPITK